MVNKKRKGDKQLPPRKADRMMNYYEIRGDITAIFLKQNNGNEMETIVDSEDLEKLLLAKLSWHAKWDNKLKQYYCEAIEQLGKIDGVRKWRSVRLHAFLIGYSGKGHIDHLNHDTLDNRKENLEEKTVRGNIINRQGANKNSHTGVRNVSLCHNKLLVQLQIGGKNKVLKKFEPDQLEEADKFAKEMRKKYYGEVK
jgi:hypothetical protein